MGSYTMAPERWNNSLFSAGGYKVYWDESDPSPYTDGHVVEPIVAPRPNRAPAYVRYQPKPAIWVMTVETPTTDDAAQQVLADVFSPDDGLVYLKCLDGDGKRWRVAAQAVSGPKRESAPIWKVPIYVPDTFWEEDATPAPVTSLNQTTTPFTQNFTVLGNRDTDDIQITITSDLTNNDGYDDYKFQFNGMFVNRAPNDLKDEPVYLCDQSGAPARLATNTSPAGATVLQTTGLTSITVDITAGASTINLASDAGWPAKGMGFLTDSRGNGFHDQFKYTGVSAQQLTGVTWLPAAANGREPGGTVITAGGIAHTQAQETAIQPSGVMLSADDMRVWLDGVETAERYPVAWNGAASDVVVLVTMPKRQRKTIVNAMTASVPATGGEIELLEGVDDLADVGKMAVDNEVICWTGRDVTRKVVTGIVRAYHTSTAAVHNAGAVAEFSIALYTVAMGKATATRANAPMSRRPALQLPGSSNQVQKWGDESNDANTAFYDPDNPSRPKSWRLGFDKDGNTASPLVSVDLTTTALRFKDDDPGDGQQPVNFAEMTFPQEIDAGNATAIVADWAPSEEILNLEMFTRDRQGEYRLVDELQQAAASSNRSPAAFAASIAAIKLKGRYNIATGFRGGSSVALNLQNSVSGGGIPPPNNVGAFKITVPRDGNYSGIVIRTKLSAAGGDSVYGYIVKDNGGVPDVTANGIIANLQTKFLPALSSTTGEFVKALFQRGQFFRAGTYWMMLWQNNTAAPTIHVLGAESYQHSECMNWVSPTWTSTFKTPWYYLLCDYDNTGQAPIFDDQPVVDPTTGARTGVTASFDGFEAVLEPAQSVYVHRFAAPANLLKHFNETVERTSPINGGIVSVDRWGPIGSTVVIDCKRRSATYTEVTYQEKMPVKTDTWLAMAPGANVLTFTAPGIRQTDYSTAYRGKKVS